MTQQCHPFSTELISTLASSEQPPDDLPWYRTVLRGTGFQLNASDIPHPTSKTRSRAVLPPAAAIPGIERQIWRSISSLAELLRAALRLAACGGREKSTHLREAENSPPPALARLFIRSTSVTRATATRAFFIKKTPTSGPRGKMHPSLSQHGLQN